MGKYDVFLRCVIWLWLLTDHQYEFFTLSFVSCVIWMEFIEKKNEVGIVIHKFMSIFVNN